MTDFPRPDLAAPIPPVVPQPAPIADAASLTPTPPVAAPSPVVTVDSSAAKGVLVSLATGAVRAAGAAFMAHGAMTQATANAIEPIIVQEIVGTALLIGGQCWASIREWLSHQKIFAAAFADPSTIVVK